mgnify:CR=1 FL=1
MLKVTTTNQNQTITMKLEGKLAGPWVQEVTRVWVDTAQSPRSGYVVDLRSVTFIDGPGQALLATMSRQGARLIAADCLTLNIVDEITKESYSSEESGILCVRTSSSNAPTIAYADLYTCPTRIKVHFISQMPRSQSRGI